jgi:hypothetical protein
MAVAVDPMVVEREAALQSTEEIAAYLQDALGQKLVAYMTGLKDPKMVGQWARGSKPRGMAEIRLRHAYQAARLLNNAYGPETTKAWLVGSNTLLDGEAPAWVLRHAQTLDDLRFVVPAARSFAGAEI